MTVVYSQEAYPIQRFMMLVLLYLKAIPWKVPSFELDH